MRTLLCLFLLTSAGLAADLPVAPGASIQAAIDAAAPGDRVLVQPGTYTETIDFKGKAIEVIGLGGPTATILDGAGAGTVASFKTGEGLGSRLSGFTLRGGNGGYGGGGGIGCGAGATPVITDCIVRNNVGKLGAGVAGSPILERCVILANTSSLNHGGGLCGAPVLRQCVVALNSATSADGGGLYVKGGKSVVEDSLFFENRAVLANSHGGGIYVDSSGSLELRRSVLVGNYSTGGAFAGYGGAISAETAGSLVEGCTIVGNSVSGSSASGGGIYGPVVVRNSIVRDNVGGDLALATAIYSDIGGGYPGVGNVDLVPGFVDQAERDFHLSQLSPVIDLGDPSLVDPDGTRSDMGAFAFSTLYVRANVTPADWDAPTWGSVPSLLGGQVRLRLSTGAAHAGELYWLLGSLSGSTPGLTLFGAALPLNYDAYMLLTLTQPNSPALAGFLGTLGASGQADATLTVPADPSGSLAGLTVSHAALFGQLTSLPVQVTDTVGVELE